MKRTALLLWFVAVAVLLAANSVVCYVNVRKLIDHSAYVSRSRETIFALDRLMSALKDAETSERGYVITQDPTYLEPYRESIAAIKTESRALDDLVPADAPQQMQVTALRALADEKLEILLKVVEIRDRQGFDAAKSAIQYGIDGRPGAPLRNGKRVMDDARTVSENLRQTEKRELDARQAERDTASTTATATLIGAGGLNVFLLIGLGVAVYRHVSARAAATAERERSARLAAEVDERHRVARTLEALNQKLETSNRELQDFAHVASHDLQEPLRKIQAFGDRLQKRFAGVLADDGRDYVDRMQNAAGRMQTLISDLLAFARVTTKAQPFVVVDLNTVTRDVLSDLEARIESSGGTVDVAPDLPRVEGDPTQVRQVVQNLISNALKFRKPDVAPHVRVAARVLGLPTPPDGAPDPTVTRTPHPLVELSIADNGIGFDEKYLDRIFNVFQRLHGRNEYEGTGIGLAVVRKIVERHGGTITAHSREGHGATFVFTLPLAQAASNATAPLHVAGGA